jgi:putative membrane protein
MSEEQYDAYAKEHEHMILRDYLAVDRTMMANETSFMSFVRTALTMIGAGVTLIKFFNDGGITYTVGWCFIVIGGWVALYGYNRFRKNDEVLHRVKGETVHRASKLKKSKIGTSLKYILGRK